MRASDCLTIALLRDYVLHDVVFRFQASGHKRKRLAAYERYHMRITRMHLPSDWNTSLLDSATGRSVLPSSLL